MKDAATRLASVRETVARAAQAARRKPEEIALIAVSKRRTAAEIEALITEGVMDFGENRVAEAAEKWPAIRAAHPGCRLHMIGQLQSNKAAEAVALFDVIHSLDSVELAERLERICVEEGRAELPVLAQVDLAGEETKSGIAEADLPPLVEMLKSCERLKFSGLMILPPFFDDREATRPYFVRLRELRDRLAAEGAFDEGGGELSMGMSHDFEVAVEEGATIVRVGTAIFGERRRQTGL